MTRTPDDKSTSGVLAACREVLESFGDRSLLAAYVYGSFLSRRRRVDSDLDIAILERKDERVSWETRCALMDALERATGSPVDLRMVREGTAAYQAHVMSAGELFWTGDARLAQQQIADIRRNHRRIRSRTGEIWESTIHGLARRIDR